MPRTNLFIRTCSVCGSKFETKHLHQETCSKSCGMTLFREKEHNKLENHEVWASGGGVQSTAIAALIVQGELPAPSFAWMVDVGYEASATFEYTNAVLIPELNKVGVTLNIIKTSDYLSNSITEKGGTVLIPAYELIEGRVIKLKTMCNSKWKQRVAQRWLKSKGVERCNVWMGISMDEKRRIRETFRKWNQNRYPLIELGLRREDCIDLIARMGWPKPEHTACYLCPNQNNFEWNRLKAEYPADFEKAVDAERRIQAVRPNVFLHRTCQTIDTVNFNE